MNRTSEIAVPAACLLLASTLAAACGGDAATSAAAREDSAGVEIVQHPGTDRSLAWRFERETVLGGAPEGPESFTSVSPAGVDVDASGRLHVLDADAFRVVVYDSSLSVERTLGGEGEGPGELAGPLGIDVDPEGEVAVSDYRKGASSGGDRTGSRSPWSVRASRSWRPPSSERPAAC